MELLLSICLLSSPVDCRKENIVVSMDPVGPMQCMMTAPQTIAQWNESHPKWRVVRWQCTPRERVKKFAI
ncbi:hypothetical protein HDIA_1941 [Hartmannibacter diazotrophicus]|uniref:Secreted protein n=1 Tax=Hartmannibacter diazotrophicus TaxID=1482074 RepID=A0A2C9D566_9HYPH|nr:hypothetical protein [Hartmannibacter diazotrophicus]SON55482.1 hypothetical protein HDIA_1941 [Hartmannibacter diazotrophicus]